jgi:hypothetical protein
MSIRTQLISGLTACFSITLAIGLLGIDGQYTTNASTLEIYQGDLVPILRIAEVRQHLHQDQMVLSRMFLDHSAAAVDLAREKLARSRKETEVAWQSYLPLIDGDAERHAADAVVASRSALATLNGQAIELAAGAISIQHTA